MRKKLSKNAVKSWVLKGMIIFIIFILIFVGIYTIPQLFNIESLALTVNENKYIINVIFVGIFIVCFIDTFVSPAFSYKQWSYSINDEEIWFREGIFWSNEVVIPIVRIQNINLKEDPISKKFNIADITIGTAGGVHKIPALDKSEVDEIMEFLRIKVNENVNTEKELGYE